MKLKQFFKLKKGSMDPWAGSIFFYLEPRQKGQFCVLFVALKLHSAYLETDTRSVIDEIFYTGTYVPQS